MAQVIVIDDSQAVRTQLRYALTAGDHTIIEAKNGSEGYHAIVNNPLADLIITDYFMPDMNGIEMLEKVIQDHGPVKLPIIILTTESSDSLKKAGKKVGIVAWIVKPFKEDLLLKAIDRLVGTKTPRV